MKHRTAITIAVAILLTAGCAAQGEPPEEEQEPLSVEDILASAPRPEDYSDSVTCLHRDAYVDVDVLNRELLLFQGRGDKVWLNRLRRPCIGLRDRDALAFEMRNSRLCDLDTFNSIDTFRGALEPASARCSLGKFETVSPEQAAALKEGLAQ